MKVGVIGSGAISDIYLKNMIEEFDNLDVLAVASRNQEHAKAKADQYGIRACTVAELLADPEIEMIVNLTPVGAHYELIKQALLAGKHVYTEKTMTDSAEHSNELAELAAEKKLYLGSAPDTFLGAALQTARSAVDEGMLGEIHSFAISANRDNSLLLSVFSFLRQPGAGIVNDYAVYYITALTSLLGPVSRVGSVIGTPYPTHRNIFPQSPEFGQEMETPNESQVSAVICMKNGITGTFHVDADSNLMDETYFAIYGTKGILYLTDPNQFGGQVRFLPKSMDPRTPAKEAVLWNFTPYADNARGVGPSEMADAIARGRTNRASKEMACHVQEVLTAILQGGENGGFTEIHSTMERPLPLETTPVPIANIGHISLQMKNETEMLRFYEETLGMKRLFTLTIADMLSMLSDEAESQDGSEAAEENASAVENEAVNGNVHAREAAGENAHADDRKKMAIQHFEQLGLSLESPWITYMKLADRQYVELFYTIGQKPEVVEDRRKYAGYTKCNFEVDSIEEIRNQIQKAGYDLKDDIHETADGSREITVLDPDGNEIQFTQYGTGDNALLRLQEDHRESCSYVRYTTQVAYQVKDTFNMRNFYTKGLGLKKAATMTFRDLYEFLEKQETMDARTLQGVKMLGNAPWIDFIAIGPHQYLELFYTPGQELDPLQELRTKAGYQHLCLEVTDIQAARKACLANGLKPDTEISLGADGSYQFWLTDPDGNRLELMEYAEGAKQLL